MSVCLTLCSEEGRRQPDRRVQDWKANARPKRRLYPGYQNRQNVKRTGNTNIQRAYPVKQRRNRMPLPNSEKRKVFQYPIRRGSKQNEDEDVEDLRNTSPNPTEQPATNSCKNKQPMNPMKIIPDFHEAEPKSKIVFNIFDNEKVSIVNEGSRVYNTYSGDTVYNFGEEFIENNKENYKEAENYNFEEDYTEYDQYENEVKYYKHYSDHQSMFPTIAGL